jgi:NADH-quinone oxidoreductase subunit J
MIFLALAFYMFASIAVVAAVVVISTHNPVHSVLFLILVFFNVAGLFVLLGAEFLAMILIVVYVGAVAVLFMFVVMMLDVSIAESRDGFLHYLPLGLLIGFILVMELGVMAGGWSFAPNVEQNFITQTIGSSVTNTEAMGNIIYTHYIFYFQTAGFILLVAMIGAIVLTHRTRGGVLKQNVGDQLARNPSNTIEVKKVSSGSGI